MKSLIITVIAIVGVFNASFSQIVTIEPADATVDDEIKITFDAAAGNGDLIGAEKVYMHSGVVLEGPNGTTWENVIGNFRQDDGVGQMTKVEGDIWEITLSPTAREYYMVDAGVNVYRLSMVFRNASGNVQERPAAGDFSGGTVAANGDIFMDLRVDNFVLLDSPSNSEVFVAEGARIVVAATASSEVTLMELLVDDGSGYSSIASVTTGTTISTTYAAPASGSYTFKVEADLGGVAVSDSIVSQVTIIPTVTTAPVPAGAVKGINYDPNDPTRAILVLEAPDKDFVYVVGDFNNWQVDDNYLMNKSGDLHWLELTGLTEQQEYVFQYWVEGIIKVGDPYADKVADPWNDEFIEETVYPNLIAYDREENGIATVLQTGQSSYQWAESESSWTPPAEQDLVVYELLIRDFVDTHYYQDVIDSLDYLKRLGVNAIELMPIMEFEGNSSWGYNPSYFFAPDKYYGTKDDLKKFIEIAHQEGFAVILDMVLNHAFGQNAMVRMYWDDANNRPADDNPWFNPVARHPFNVGYDFDHTSVYTEDFVDSVNRYWIEEYHFDGYRFDLSKGFTQVNTGDDVGAWSAYDVSRISILRRMYNKIRSYAPNAYVILEHFADAREEEELGQAGMLLWRNSHGDFSTALRGEARNIESATSTIHVSYMESHDEQRVMYEMLQNGNTRGSYSTRNVSAALERAKMGAAFLFLQPGPKMLWQFGELGYDLDINLNGRTGEKPLPWGTEGLGYYEDELRQYVYDAYDAIIDLRNRFPQAITTSSVSGSLSTDIKTLTVDHSDINIVLVGNFGLAEAETSFSFTKTGEWFDYFSGESISASSTSYTQTLGAGEFVLYTDQRLSEGFPGVVERYTNPVTIDPSSFGLDDEITITVQADNTSPSLGGSESIRLVGGLVTDSEESTGFEFEASGPMTNLSGDTWEITLTPRDFFGVPAGTDVFRLGVFFTNGDGSREGYGFREKVVFFRVNPENNIISVDPPRFYTNEEIKISFDASFGEAPLQSASKVYMHSGVVKSDKEQPTGSDWSNVIGNFLEDDGLGQMSKVQGTETWEITVTPAEYYSLAASDSVYWLSMVFRNADGSLQTSPSAGNFGQIYISGGGDIFYRVLPPEQPLTVSKYATELSLYPNPAGNWVGVSTGSPESTLVVIYAANGAIVKKEYLRKDGTLDISDLRKGLYFLQLQSQGPSKTLKLIKE